MYKLEYYCSFSHANSEVNAEETDSTGANKQEYERSARPSDYSRLDEIQGEIRAMHLLRVWREFVRDNFLLPCNHGFVTSFVKCFTVLVIFKIGDWAITHKLNFPKAFERFFTS